MIRKFITTTYKASVIGKRKMALAIDNIILRIRFFLVGAKVGSFKTIGQPFLNISLNGRLKIGKNFRLNNGIVANPIGCYERCTIVVENGTSIIIGDNVGISQTALIAADNIKIGDNVKMGGGVCVWTTDFHALNPSVRSSIDDVKYRKKAPVEIKENAFIGGKSTILKGVTIGRNSIVAAGSIVTKSIPDNQIWGGNPAKFIKDI